LQLGRGAARRTGVNAAGNRQDGFAMKRSGPCYVWSRARCCLAAAIRKRIFVESEMGGSVMTTARDIMHAGAECVGEHETLQYAAQRMRDLDVGSLPICGDDDRLHGIITDRDIVIKCVAAGGDPAAITAGELAQGKPVTVESDAHVSDVLRAMKSRQIRRVPVIHSHRLVGMISEADLARHLPEQAVGEFVEAVCGAG